MTTTDTDMDLRIRTFKASSSFTPGDAFSFSINFGEDVSLPGKFDPVSYMTRLGADVAGKNVLVVCPGNGGLAVAALRAGASTVVALEPRSIYHRALPVVSELADDVIGATFSLRMGDDKPVESFDIVFWAEGLDEVPHPKGLISNVVGSMKKGGTLYLEANLGHQGSLPDSVNAWRPTEEALKEGLIGLAELTFTSELAGRNQTRKIYTITNNTVRIDVLPGSDFKAVDEVEEFTNRVKADLKIPEQPAKVADLAVEGDEQLPVPVLLGPAAQAVADKIKAIIPPQTPGELDSIYEGRVSTPKSNEETKAKIKRSKGTESKSK